MKEIKKPKKQRRRQLIGHVLRRNENEYLKEALTWKNEGKM